MSRSWSHEPRAAELVTDDLIQPRRHLRRHVVHPVAGDPFPEERVPGHGVVRPRRALLVHLQTLHLLEAAQLHHRLHGAGALLGERERPAHELRQPPHVLARVLQQVLVPEEEHPVGPREARAPVAEHVVPDRADGHGAVADVLEQLREREVRLPAPEEVPQRDDHVLGVPADVRHLAAGDGAAGDRLREQGVRHVRVHEARRREPLQLGLMPVREDLVQERDAVVRVEAEERVLRRRRVRVARHGGERQRLEPRGAALGVAGEDHVVGVWDEAPLEDDGARHPVVRQPEALVQAQLQAGLILARQRCHEVPELLLGWALRHRAVVDVRERNRAGSVGGHGGHGRWKQTDCPHAASRASREV
ncbi:hypothetical protein ACQJBY_008816 [Aegilops geniculata]